MVGRRHRALLAVAATCVSLVAAECPNACSGHGTCGAYDMCTCYAGYIANDCSERVCPFATAHVDSPIGDLNADQSVDADVTAAGNQFSPNMGELFPFMKNTAGTVTQNSAHYYAECANKGICDRVTALCKCFTGYEGSACQRTTCPNDCNGHGTCMTNRELAAADYGNVYELWDADVQQGCKCDAGFDGYDCALRQCPYGVDPLYLDDENTARVPTWTAAFTTIGAMSAASGTWRLKFYDVFGEDWVTEPITYAYETSTTVTAAAMATAVEDALEALPFDVVPDVTVDATMTTTTLSIEMAFTSNPGALRVPEVITTDGAGRDTFTITSTSTTALTSTITDRGVVGEFYDDFGQNCGVTVTVTKLTTGTYGYVAYFSSPASTDTDLTDFKAVKKCLGDSNGDTSDNVDVYNWDYGSVDVTNYVPAQNPHLVKLVSTSAADETDGGVFAIAFWDDDNSRIALTTTVAAGDYYLFATDGVLERVWYDVNDDNAFTITADDMGLARFTQYDSVIYTSRDFSCQNADSTATEPCLEKGDLIVLPSSMWGNAAGSGITGGNIAGLTVTAATLDDNTAGVYEIKKIAAYVSYPDDTSETLEDRYVITLDRPVFWDGSDTDTAVSSSLASTVTTGLVQVFKFTPAADTTLYRYPYVQQCAGRGLCDTESGLCSCFSGYTNENCDTQQALAL